MSQSVDSPAIPATNTTSEQPDVQAHPDVSTPSGVRKCFVLDTNVLLHNPSSLFKFAEHEVVIPLTIEELDRFKKNNDETGRNSRQVIRAARRAPRLGRLFEGVTGTTRAARSGSTGAIGAELLLDLDVADNRILGVAH